MLGKEVNANNKELESLKNFSRFVNTTNNFYGKNVNTTVKDDERLNVSHLNSSWETTHVASMFAADFNVMTKMAMAPAQHDNRFWTNVTRANEPLHVAVATGNQNWIVELLDNGADVNNRGISGSTPLHIAAEKGYETIVNLLLSRNASIDTKDFYGNAAIHYAVALQQLNVVEILLEHGANVNIKARCNLTPLSTAVQVMIDIQKCTTYVTKNCFVENRIMNIMKALVKHGAEVNSSDTFGLTAMHGVAAMGYADIVGYLASKNASFKIEDNICFTPIQWAANNGNIDVIKTLLENDDDINRKGCNNVTALHLAIRRNDTDLMEFLFSEGADPNVMNEEGYTPLDVAFQRSSQEFIKVLLKHEAKVEDESFLGSKVLFDAVANKSLELVKLLLDRTENFDTYPTLILNYAIGTRYSEVVKLFISYGANIDKPDIHGNLPLSSGVMSRNTDLFKLILETGVKRFVKENFQTFLDAVSYVNVHFSRTNCRESHQLGALHIASHHGLLEVVELLIAFGASLDIRDERMYTPLHYACEEGHVEVVKLLLDSGANKGSADINGTTPLHIACRRGLFQIVESLLSDPPAAIDQTDHSGYTPLHFAAINGSQETVLLLLSRGADKEAKTNDLKSPLHFASLEGHKEVVEILLNAGADKEAADIDGMTSLHFAARERYLEVILSILRSASSVNIKNKNGSTPLHLSCEKYNFRRNSSDDLKLDGFFIVTALLHFGGDVEPIDSNQMTPLHVASRDGFIGCVKALFNGGAKKSTADKWGYHAIHYAALNGHRSIFSMISLADKKELLSVNDNYETSLNLASREGHFGIVSDILMMKSVSFIPDITGRTPLHHSANRGHLEIVKILLTSLARKDTEDKWGFTALNYAASWKGYQEVMEHLLDTQLNITLSYYFNISNPFELKGNNNFRQKANIFYLADGTFVKDKPY